MAQRGGQIGNQNAAKGKEWTDALRRALKRYETDDIKRGKALLKIAHKLVEDALEGKEYAVREISERLDGKVSAGEGDRTIRVVVTRQFDIEPRVIEPVEVRRLREDTGGTARAVDGSNGRDETQRIGERS